MHKVSILALSLFFATVTAFTVEIDTALLSTARRVAYIEDTTPISSAEYNTAEQIRNMGRRLGQTIRAMERIQKIAQELLYANGAPSRKYQVTRVYESDVLAGADILYIAPNATVGTAKALFLIVSGYIETAYDIPIARADTLAQQVCWWNTNHYDERTYFTGRFNARVLDAFANETAVIGLADSYKNWAGHARIVIPFIFTQNDATALSNATDASKNTAVSSGAADNSTSADNMQNNKAIANDTVTVLPHNTEKTRTAAAQLAGNLHSMPIQYKILFTALCLAALLLIILLIKVIRDMARA
ncbi:MAG: hypothetical protein J6I73_01540 [Treponema sp.]|nr:hypothetical protein [Treponema sp.]